MAYEGTSVTIEKSQGDTRKLLRKHGADGYQFSEVEVAGTTVAALQFRHQGYAVRMGVPYKEPDLSAIRSYAKGARKSEETALEVLEEREGRRIWRVLHWSLKARLEAVEEGVETFEQAFLAHVLNPATGRTVYEDLAGTGRVELPEPMPRLALPGAG